MSSSILITGGLGFLGHHLSKRLLTLYPECKLTIVDNLSSTIIDYSWLNNRAEIIIEDFRDVKLSSYSFDQIYHLASPVGSLGILDKSGYIVKIISDLAVHAAEIAASNNASLLYVSSSEVYGKSGIQDENDELVIPVNSGARMEYILGKLAAEHILHNMAFRKEFKLTIVRPFNIFGEHQTSKIGFVVPTFFENAVRQNALPVFFDGSQKRCFCYVDDIVNGIIAIQELGRSGETYNLGNPSNSISIGDLAHTIINMCGSSAEIEHIDPQRLYGKQYIEASEKYPSIDKVMQHTGWRPEFDLESGLSKLSEFYGVLV
jgi:nucleoside-diphosphate-sugar epimerase